MDVLNKFLQAEINSKEYIWQRMLWGIGVKLIQKNFVNKLMSGVIKFKN